MITPHMLAGAVMVAGAFGTLIGGWVATGAAHDRERALREQVSKGVRKVHGQNVTLRSVLRTQGIAAAPFLAEPPPPPDVRQ